MRNETLLTCGRLDLPAAVDCGDAAGQIAICDARKSGLANKVGERLLVREATNALNEIAVGIGVAGGQFSEAGNNFERVEIIEPVEDRHLALREFEAKPAAARLQHAVGFGERPVDVRDVADAECDRIGVEAAVCEG